MAGMHAYYSHQMRLMNDYARRGPSSSSSSSEMHHGHCCCCYNVVTVAARAPVVVVTLLLLLLLVAAVPGHAVFDVYADEVMDVAMLEDGSSCHFRMTPPVVPESPEERREHYRVMEAKDLGRHRRQIMAEGTSSSGSGSSSAAEEEDLNLMPVPKLMSTSATDMSELMSSTSTFEMPMRSALTVVDVGMYLVTVLLGTPALPYSMALDTANDLTWVNCRLRGHRRHRDRDRGRRRPPPIKPPSTVTIMSMDDASDPVNTAAVDKSAGGKYVRSWYRPAQSRSWRRYRCSQADSCGLFPHNECQSNLHNESCTYESRTQDGTVTRGIYGSETATVAVSGGRMARLPGLVLGCSTYEAGGAVAMHDGILTLGNQDVSFGTVAARHFKGRFSFCLLPTRSSGNASSYLTFGPNPAMAAGAGARETRIVYNPLVPAFGVHVTGLFINGKRLDIPPEVWQEDNKGGGLHIDTGTSLTGLVEPAYGEVTRAITRHLAHLKKEDITGFDHCYWWTFTGDDGVDPAHNVTIPRLEIEFEGGARLDPGAKGVVVPEAAPGVVCVAFRRRELGPSVLGNVQMQDHIWEVDHLNGVLRFKKDTCLNHNLPPPPPPPSPPAPKSE